MKKINIYMFAFFVVGLSFLTSCDKDNEGSIYHPAATETGVTFDVNLKINPVSIPATSSFFDIYLLRATKAGDLEVPITFTDASGLFTAPTSAKFKDGSFVDTIRIEVSDATIIGEKYSLSLAFDQKYCSTITSAINKKTITFNKDYVYELMGTGTFTSEFFEKSWSKEVYVAEGFPHILKIKDCYAVDTDIYFEMDAELKKIAKFTTQKTGYNHPSYGMVTATYRAANSSVSGKKISFGLEMTVAAGSFGIYEEVLVMP